MIIIVVDYIFLKTLVLTTDNDTKMIYNLEDCPSDEHWKNVQHQRMYNTIPMDVLFSECKQQELCLFIETRSNGNVDQVSIKFYLFGHLYLMDGARSRRTT